MNSAFTYFVDDFNQIIDRALKVGVEKVSPLFSYKGIIWKSFLNWVSMSLIYHSCMFVCKSSNIKLMEKVQTSALNSSICSTTKRQKYFSEYWEKMLLILDVIVMS